MGDLSEHFSTREFACRCQAHQAKKRTDFIPPPLSLLSRLEAHRSNKGGRPIRVVSGYRCPSHQLTRRRPGSRHPRGDACDLQAGVMTVPEALALGFKGIGKDRNGWVRHVDMRPGRTVIFDDNP